MKYCCVPGCNGYGGHKFPKTEPLKMKWRVAIRRMDEKKRLWDPNHDSVVCGRHFKPSDYKVTLLGKYRVSDRSIRLIVYCFCYLFIRLKRFHNFYFTFKQVLCQCVCLCQIGGGGGCSEMPYATIFLGVE